MMQRQRDAIWRAAVPAAMVLLNLGPGLTAAVSAQGEAAALGQPSEFTWGLNLPARPVSRRLTRYFQLHDPNPIVLGDLQGPGCIRRLWVAGKNFDRDVVLRIYFDGESVPGVEAPLPDFFGVMHNLANPGEAYPINTPFLDVKPRNGFTATFPMPFARSARVEVVGGGAPNNHFYYMIDWHEYPGQEMKEPMRFCARWRREAPVRDNQDDFIILDAEGPGRLVGFAYSVDMLESRQTMRWSHAGGDRIYIDGQGDQPAYLRGLGGEDSFGVSYGGNEYKAQSNLFADMPYYVQKDFQGERQKLAAYRFFAHDTIDFCESIHVRFGSRAHDVAATAYWYSAKPVRPFFTMPPLEQRRPGSQIRRGEYDLPLPDTRSWEALIGPSTRESCVVTSWAVVRRVACACGTGERMRSTTWSTAGATPLRTRLGSTQWPSTTGAAARP